MNMNFMTIQKCDKRQTLLKNHDSLLLNILLILSVRKAGRHFNYIPGHADIAWY